MVIKAEPRMVRRSTSYSWNIFCLSTVSCNTRTNTIQYNYSRICTYKNILELQRFCQDLTYRLEGHDKVCKTHYIPFFKISNTFLAKNLNFGQTTFCFALFHWISELRGPSIFQNNFSSMFKIDNPIWLEITFETINCEFYSSHMLTG